MAKKILPSSLAQPFANSLYAAQAAGDEAAAAPYRAALEKASYRDAGLQYGAGMGQITNYLAGAGPMYDSGGATALRSKLASSIYGGAAGRIGNKYADYLAQIGHQRRQYQYQMALMKQQKKMQQTGFGGVAGAIAGGALSFLGGGPAGAAAGNGLGGGGGGSYTYEPNYIG